MSWGMVAGAAVSVVGGKLLNGGSKGSAASAAADPFAASRGQYEQPLQDLIGQKPTYQSSLGQMSQLAGSPNIDPTRTAAMQSLAGQGLNPNNTAQMQQLAGMSIDPGTTARMNAIAGSQGTAAGAQLSAMTASGGKFDSTDPSYKFRFDQGQQALERSAAAKGMGMSGNVLTALADYGQGAASQEYQSQFNRLSSLSQQQQSQQQQQFGQLGALNDQRAQAIQQQFSRYGALNAQQQQENQQQFGQLSALQQQQAADKAQTFGNLNSVYTNSENQYQNEYARLAQLSGANVGSPAAAGQLLQQQQAGAAAFTQPLISKIGDSAGSAISNWFTPSTDTSAGVNWDGMF